MPFKQPRAALLGQRGSNVRRQDNVGVLGIGLVVLTLQMQTGGFNLANADELAEPLYPGRYVANCKPAPGFFGCICDTDSTSQVSTLPPVRSKLVTTSVASKTSSFAEWLRLTCAAITQPREIR